MFALGLHTLMQTVVMQQERAALKTVAEAGHTLLQTVVVQKERTALKQAGVDTCMASPELEAAALSLMAEHLAFEKTVQEYHPY